MSNKIVPFYPIYTKPPCQLIEYIEEPFDDGFGHTGIVRTAVYLDKHKKQQKCTAQVIWHGN
jgi:hypothetical protein